MENRSDDACKADKSDQTICIEVERYRQVIREKFIQSFSIETSGEWTTEFSGTDLSVCRDDTKSLKEGKSQ